ncbi:MAG: nucleotidyltransferase [Anaerolineae bacterium]|nr:nucleotidyltransferase [Anaerolineae bacterium]
MPNTIKIAIPMAGYGSRMRPQTWSRPKPLLALAGKTALDYCLAQFDTLPPRIEREYIFIVGAQGDQVREHMAKHHPEKTVHYVTQLEMRGQSDALYLAREYLRGPMLMAFSDTLIETDLAFLAAEALDGIAWVKPVPDPRRFGVAEAGADGLVTRMIEKPSAMDNNRAVVGFYYFRSGEDLMTAIESQFKRKLSLRGEFFLTDAINVWLEGGRKMRIQQIDTWLDAGIPETLLETNGYYLAHGAANEPHISEGTVIPPVFIHPNARIESAVIGPYVSIGANCHIKDAVIRNSILDEDCQVQNAVLKDTLLGKRVRLEGKAIHTHLGDDAWQIQ